MKTKTKLKTPYKDLLPPLSTEEREALKADIKAHGVKVPIEIDEDGNILDGHHRHAICKDAPTTVIPGLSIAEKVAHVLKSASVHRNLSPAQQADVRKAKKKAAAALRKEDPKKWTQSRVAVALGVARSTVEMWFLRSNDKGVKTSKPDARVKVNPKHKPIIAKRVQAGEKQAQVAADYGVSQRTVSTIVKKEEKVQTAKKEQKKAAAKIKGETLGVHHGDFREAGKIVEAQTVNLIFTDPPYDKEAVSLYADLGHFAARVLRPGGWCLAYTGQAFLPEVLAALSDSLTYGWTFAISHTGGDLRYRKFKIQNKWKPIVGFYKPPLSVIWDWFPDLTSGGKEKDEHEWQQSEAEAAHYIQAMCIKGGLVCDPFAGSGTSLVATKKLGRKWVGFEIDKEHVQGARLRINDTTKT